MAGGVEAWAELMKASAGLARTSLQANEMLVASSSVIGARITIMSTAARRPADGDYAELSGMVSEKVVAASRVNQVLFDQWSAMLLDAWEQAQHVGASALWGRPLSGGDLLQLADRWLAHGTRMMTRTMEVGGLALAPVHKQATANARRLR
jgi:hypothetical protein